ncbi:MAG: UDP-N-acetylmuramoyl-L-alanine--D-glutamate ligase [Candidatus Omnitrophica bacterium]|nr:UDP-N-acetylmuramoyl-L-alanine--D-glutamate ligase [Candidatus Omnitrophota bacterium]MCB9747800.1 UDP-N-acetylmuramoyl-L-alanine--D-glutamate ligase [Candidatus Omnitrophota bacterium]
MLDINNKKITIIGAKKTGSALINLILHFKGIAKISETASFSQEHLDWFDKHCVQYESGGHSEAFIKDSDIVVISPGVRMDGPAVCWARFAGIPVLGEIEFAAQFCTVPIIAVTGSNGKSTVSTLIYEILHANGKKVALCGNIGYPFSQCLVEQDNLDYIVIEVSSFQLESMLEPNSPFLNKNFKGRRRWFKGFKPKIAVLLNLNQNHLDRHKDMEEYFQAKARLFSNQDNADYAVIDGDGDYFSRLRTKVNAQIIPFNTNEQGENFNHNAVMKVGQILKVDNEICSKVFTEFRGLEHRLEWVRNLDGIDFINDSKATTAEACRWALNQINQPILMICGGRDKNIDFSVLAHLVHEKVKKIFAFGEAKQKIKQTFETFVQVEECDVLENAVRKARSSANKGDCVVLTPMCTSFDMFTNFEERGRVFKEIVNKLE